jgi:hypothetical protein
VHKNTVRYRLRRAEELLGRRLTPAHADLDLAIRACQYLEDAVPQCYWHPAQPRRGSAGGRGATPDDDREPPHLTPVRPRRGRVTLGSWP